MIDVASDFVTAYIDFGEVAYINGASDPVVVIVDNDLDMDDSGMTFVRALKNVVIERNDVVVLLGETYKAVKVYPYGDQKEENVIALKVGS